MLFSLAELKEDFTDFAFHMEELAVHLNEGPYHQGTGFVVRGTAVKPR
jgi:hypothetical protein